MLRQHTASQTCFQDLPSDILPLVVQHLASRDSAAASCVAKQLKKHVQEVHHLSHVNKFTKLQAIFNDMISQCQSDLVKVPPLTISFHNKQGYVLFSMIHDGMKLFYKLDGLNNSPRFTLTSRSLDLFYKFVMRETDDIRGYDLYTARKDAASSSSFFYTLQKRLQSALL
jgi:hypothetical protein